MSFAKFCESLNCKLTPLRRDVLVLLWRAKHPLKAYEILTELKKTRTSAKPPTVYRVLDYFIDQHVLHKLDSCQSYTLCHSLGSDHPKSLHIMFLCQTCQKTIEIVNANTQTMMQQLAEQHQFQVVSDLIEVEGVCDGCCTLTHKKL